ncbi:hypothetical protein Bca4012_076805 [Brassica carinata]|uniref:FCP1 homology domain-containing protein n=1 Tax=Brassica carinata TaxID=52824 RepID=A0A8X7QEE0_BRACI|nr:hypothetical protein Bca52824_072933 [Brassica carinata]
MATERIIENKPESHKHQKKNDPFMCFTATTTTSYPATRHDGYTKLTKYTNTKRTIILDLDETLVHSTTQMPGVKYDFMVMVKMKSEIMPIFVVKRETYNVAVFTAGLEDYASQVLDKLDKKGVISQRLYRDSCTELNGRYVKDLTVVVGKDLGSALIVDDNPFAYSLQPENGVPITAFVDYMKDQELLKMVEFLKICYVYEDMRDAVQDLLPNRLM